MMTGCGSLQHPLQPVQGHPLDNSVEIETDSVIELDCSRCLMSEVPFNIRGGSGEMAYVCVTHWRVGTSPQDHSPHIGGAAFSLVVGAWKKWGSSCQ